MPLHVSYVHNLSSWNYNLGFGTCLCVCIVKNIVLSFITLRQVFPANLLNILELVCVSLLIYLGRNYTNSLDFYQNIFIAEFRDVSLSILSSIFFYYLLSLVENSLFNRKTVFLRSTYVCGLFSICHLLSKLRQKNKTFCYYAWEQFQ